MNAARPSADAASATKRLHLIDDLRGAAILCIVMLHAGNALIQRGLGPPAGSTPEVAATVDILFHSATIYFAVISGLLYAHQFRFRPNAVFLKSRFINIGSPYLVMTLALTGLLLAVEARRADGAFELAAYPARFLSNLLRGEAWNTFWYIPVILTLSALSPWLYAIVSRPSLRAALIALVLAPLIFSRTGTVLTLPMLVHFAGAYTVGLLIGTDIGASLNWLRRKWPLVATVAALATLSLVAMYSNGTDLLGAVSLRESAFYVQRIAIVLLLMPMLADWPEDAAPRVRRWLQTAAAMSFGIYFLHGPLLRPIARIVGAFVPENQPWPVVVLAIVICFLLALFASLALIWLSRRAFGPRSRYIVGS